MMKPRPGAGKGLVCIPGVPGMLGLDDSYSVGVFQN